MEEIIKEEIEKGKKKKESSVQPARVSGLYLYNVTSWIPLRGNGLSRILQSR